jgi:hypothetical protein
VGKALAADETQEDSLFRRPFGEDVAQDPKIEVPAVLGALVAPEPFDHRRRLRIRGGRGESPLANLGLGSVGEEEHRLGK